MMNWETFKKNWPSSTYDDYVNFVTRAHQAQKELRLEDLKKKVMDVMPVVRNAVGSPQWTDAKVKQNYYDPNNEFLVNDSTFGKWPGNEEELLKIVKLINENRTNPSPKEFKENPPPFKNPFGYGADVLPYPTWDNPSMSSKAYNNPMESIGIADIYERYILSKNFEQTPEENYIPPVPRFVPSGPAGSKSAYPSPAAGKTYSPQPNHQMPIYSGPGPKMTPQYTTSPNSQRPNSPPPRDNFALWLSNLLKGLR